MVTYYALLVLLPLHFTIFLGIRRERLKLRKTLMALWRVYPTRTGRQLGIAVQRQEGTRQLAPNKLRRIE